MPQSEGRGAVLGEVKEVAVYIHTDIHTYIE